MPGVNRLYIGRPRLARLTGPSLGPNLLTNPNGAYASAPWTPTALTETTGQTDPLGGSTASLLTDTAASSQHIFEQGFTSPGSKVLVTVYFKPGTYTGGICITDSALYVVNVTNAGVPSVGAGSPFNLSSSTVGGFFKITFNLNGGGYASPFRVAFGANAPTYAGTLQTQTFWGMSLQTST